MSVDWAEMERNGTKWNQIGDCDVIVFVFEGRKKGNSIYKLEWISRGNVTGAGNNQYPGQSVNICRASTSPVMIYHQHRSIYSIDWGFNQPSFFNIGPCWLRYYWNSDLLNLSMRALWWLICIWYHQNLIGALNQLIISSLHLASSR